MKLQFKFKRGALAFCLFILSIFFVYGVYASSYEEVSKSTVTIVHENGLGTGFFIDKNLLVTNYHVVENAADGVVFFRTQDGIKDAGKVVVADEESDLAIIRTLRNNYQALEMGSDAGLKMGDEIFVIGSPKGLGGTLSKGIISAQRRGDRIQITAPISSGSSGSPVFSKDFKVIGISVSYMPEGQNLNFAIPVSKLQDLMQKNKMALKRDETEEVTRQSESDFDKVLASYVNKENKTPQDMFYSGYAYYLKRNYQKALYWYRKSADQEYVAAQFSLGEMYYEGEGVVKNYKKAVYWYQKAANQGHRYAQFYLGLMYDNGEGVVKDYKKAVYWYQKAADQEYASAQFNLGVSYDKGKGVTKDYKKAVYWYQKAADQEHASAQNNLGRMYNNGEGVVKDHKKAVYWYQKAADQGNASAQYNLALKYNKGAGVAKDYKKAIYWYQKAADQGDADAQNNLGLMYNNGEGVVKDYKKAVYWFKKAANQGNAIAQYNLAVKYYYGEGVVKNYIEAYKWVILAKAQSNEDDEKINKVIDLLESVMTSGQIARAQDLANQFEAQSE